MLFKSNAPEWIVVFLGNPGEKYAATRHNAGFMAADALCKRDGISISRLKFHALTAIHTLGGKSVLLMKPQTYMNLSGEAVHEAAAFYKIPPERVVVISDDVALPAGKLRIRREGSSGGHNGLKNIAAQLGSEKFPRIKIGVGIPGESDEMINWVIGNLSKSELKTISEAAERIAPALEALLSEGIDAAMNKFN